MRRGVPGSSARGSLALVLLFVAACASETPQPQPQPQPQPYPVSGGSTMQVAGDAVPSPEAQVAGQPSIPPLDPGTRDPRRAVLRPRAASLLVAEIQQVESLFVKTEKSSPERPRMMWRIAEDYVELATAEAREQKNGADPARVERAKKVQKAARLAAIKYYKQLESELPRSCHMAAAPGAVNTGCLDEALYFMGLEYEALGDYSGARKAYFSLVQSFPQSALVPYVFFGFGEIFLKETQTEPGKRSLALAAYAKAAEHSESPIAAAARGRIALVCDSMGASSSEPDLCAQRGSGGTNIAE